MSFKGKIIFVLSFFLCTGIAQTAEADIFRSDRDGLYLGLDLGIAIEQDTDLNASDNDVPTACDQILRSKAPGDGGFLDITGSDCGRGDRWKSEAEFGTGVLTGVQAGYVFGNFRAEAEYLYRNNNSEKRGDVDIEGTKSGELVAAFQSLTSLSRHSFFANLYYDFVNESDITPYVGVGAGWQSASAIFGSTFTRNVDPDFLAGLSGDAANAAAGTTTNTDDVLRDDVFSWQVIAGSDYEIDKNWSIGLKFRYIRSGKIEDGGRWDQLRGHEGAVSRDEYDDTNLNLEAQTTEEIRAVAGFENFDPNVAYRVKTEDTSAWAASLNLKYKFRSIGNRR